MKNFITRLGIIAFVAIICFSFASCEDDSPDILDGTTWRATDGDYDYVLTFNSPNFTLTSSPGEFTGGKTETENGTYSISGNTVTMVFIYWAGPTETITATISGNTLKKIWDMTFTKQ
jgi:hypothetical protein